MFGDLLRRGLVLVVCACGVAAAGEPNEPVAEANEPWIAGEHLAPGWQSMALTTRFYNSGEPTSSGKTPQRSLSFAGCINVIDPNGLIGLSETATNVRVFDELGHPIHVVGVSEETPSSSSPAETPVYEPLKYRETLSNKGRTLTRLPYEFSIDLLMEPSAPFPQVLSRVEWSMSVLRSDDVVAVDIPFVITPDWIELTPGLEVLVVAALVQENTYSYRIQARYDPNKICYLDCRERPAGFKGRWLNIPYTWPGRVLPDMIITTMDVLDVEGNSIWDKPMQSDRMSMTMGTGFTDSDGLRIGTRFGAGTCSECGKAAFIRHVIAFSPYEQEAQFVLENIPVPTD